MTGRLAAGTDLPRHGLRPQTPAAPGAVGGVCVSPTQAAQMPPHDRQQQPGVLSRRRAAAALLGPHHRAHASGIHTTAQHQPGRRLQIQPRAQRAQALAGATPTLQFLIRCELGLKHDHGQIEIGSQPRLAPRPRTKGQHRQHVRFGAQPAVRLATGQRIQPWPKIQPGWELLGAVTEESLAAGTAGSRQEPWIVSTGAERISSPDGSPWHVGWTRSNPMGCRWMTLSWLAIPHPRDWDYARGAP